MCWQSRGLVEREKMQKMGHEYRGTDEEDCDDQNEDEVEDEGKIEERLDGQGEKKDLGAPCCQVKLKLVVDCSRDHCKDRTGKEVKQHSLNNDYRM